MIKEYSLAAGPAQAKLSLSREVLRNLVVRTGVKAGSVSVKITKPTVKETAGDPEIGV